jgi:hypothetical protein
MYANPGIQEAAPKNTGQLFMYILKKIPGRLLKALPLVIITGLFTWLLHSFLLVFVNEGFSPSTWLGRNLLNVSGKLVSSTLLWGLVGALIPMGISFIASGGNPANSIKALFGMPGQILKKNKATGNALLPVMLISCGVTLLLDKMLSGVAGFVAGGVMMSSLVAFMTGRGSIFVMTLRMVFVDIQAYVLKKKNPRLDSDSVFMIIGSSGMVLVLFGFFKTFNIIPGFFTLVMRIIPIPAVTMIVGLVMAVVLFFIGSIWFILLVIGTIMMLRNKSVPKTMIFLALIFFGAVAANRYFGIPIFADDGGWKEAGGTLGGWIGSEGSFIAVIRGIPPAVGGVGGSLISSVLTGLGGGIGGGVGGGVGGVDPGQVVPGGDVPAGDVPGGDVPADQIPQDQAPGQDGGKLPQEGSQDSQQQQQDQQKEEPVVSEEERQRKEQEWIKQERERMEKARLEQEQRTKELWEKRRLEYERMQREKEEQRIQEAARKEQERLEKERAERQAYVDRLCKKYNTTPDKLRDVLGQNIKDNQAEADRWSRIEKVLGVGETIAQGTVVVADTLIDGMANAGGPAGRAVRGVYKVTKGVASTMASDGMSLNSATRGLVTGGADAATDFIDSAKAKAAVTIIGETVGGAIKGGTDGALDGLRTGIYNATTNAITDKISGPGYGNDMKQTLAGNGKTTVSITDYKGLVPGGGNWTSRTVTDTVATKFAGNKISNQITQSTIKGVTGLGNEFVGKPIATKVGILPE